MRTPAVTDALQLAGLRPPRTLTIAVTGTCNLSCSHCWVEAGKGGSAGDVPGETLRRVIAQFAELGGSGLRLTGGEPLCHPDIFTLLHFARSAGFSALALQTNGMLVDDACAIRLRSLDFDGLTLQISMDGASAATHDAVRGIGAFDGLLKGIYRLVDAGLGPRISLFFTEMHHNLPELPAVLELAERLGVGWVTSGALLSCGRARTDTVIAPASPKQYRNLLQVYRDDPEFRRRYDAFGTVAAIEWSCSNAPREEACTFVENPYLTARGRLYPCVLCHADRYSVDRVFQKTLADAFIEGAPLWGELLQVSRRRQRDLEQCSGCPERPSCAGGCLGRALGSCGDPMAPDDRCAVRKEIGKKRR